VDKLQDEICLVGGEIVRTGIFSKKTRMYKQFFYINSSSSNYGRPTCWLTSSLKLDKKPQEPTILPDFVTGSAQIIHRFSTVDEDKIATT
jgi:hypothetical protein